MKRAQSGFTLIEMIMVIVILGVLASFALPKFADLSDTAKTSVMEGVKGSVRSASALVHAQWLAEGGSGTSVSLDDGTSVTLINGYIDENSIDDAIELDGDVTVTLASAATSAAATIFSFSNTTGDPCIVYDWDSGDTGSPSITPATGVGTYTDVGDDDDPANDTCA